MMSGTIGPRMLVSREITKNVTITKTTMRGFLPIRRRSAPDVRESSNWRSTGVSACDGPRFLIPPHGVWKAVGVVAWCRILARLRAEAQSELRHLQDALRSLEAIRLWHFGS